MAGFIETVFGKKRAATGESLATIDDVQRALQCLAQEREAAQRKVAGSGEARRSLLLVDGSDAKIIELDKETDAARLHLERCDISEEILLGRLRELEGEQRRAQFDQLLEAFRTEEARLDQALAAVIGPLDAYLKAAAAIDRAGFSAQGASLIERPPIFNDGVVCSARTLETWRQARERAADRRAAFSARKVLPLPAAKGPYRTPAFVPPAYVAAKPAPRKVEPGPRDPGWLRREPIRLSGPVRPGYRRIEALLSNVSFEDKMTVTGDQFEVLEEIAAYVLTGTAFKLIALPEDIEKAAQ